MTGNTKASKHSQTHKLEFPLYQHETNNLHHPTLNDIRAKEVARSSDLFEKSECSTMKSLLPIVEASQLSDH